MKLHDPQRPTMPNGLPSWLCGNVAIMGLEAYPADDEAQEITLSAFLPISWGEQASRRFSMKVTATALAKLLHDFANDPEAFCEAHFADPALALRHAPRRSASAPRPAPSARALEELEIIF